MPEMLSQADAGIVHGLASDVDNMRRELSQVRELGKQLEQWRKEIAPMQRLAGELRGLISDAKGFGSIELTVKELRQQMDQCLYTDKRVDDLWKSLHERTDHATVYTANLSIAQDKRIDELFEKVEELNSFIDNDEAPLALVQLSNRVSQLEGNVPVDAADEDDGNEVEENKYQQTYDQLKRAYVYAVRNAELQRENYSCMLIGSKSDHEQLDKLEQCDQLVTRLDNQMSRCLNDAERAGVYVNVEVN